MGRETQNERDDADAVSTGSTAELPQNLQAQIEEFEDVFTVDTAILKKVVDHFVKELQKGETSIIPAGIRKRTRTQKQRLMECVTLGLSVEGGNIVSCRIVPRYRDRQH